LPATLNTYLSKPRQNAKNNDLNLGTFLSRRPYFEEGERGGYCFFFVVFFSHAFLLFLELNAAISCLI